MSTKKVCLLQIFKFPACPLLSMTSKSGGVQWQFDRHWFTRLTSVWLSPSNSIAGFVLLVIRDNPYNAWLTKAVQKTFNKPHQIGNNNNNTRQTCSRITVLAQRKGLVCYENKHTDTDQPGWFLELACICPAAKKPIPGFILQTPFRFSTIFLESDRICFDSH